MRHDVGFVLAYPTRCADRGVGDGDVDDEADISDESGDECSLIPSLDEDADEQSGAILPTSPLVQDTPKPNSISNDSGYVFADC